MHHTFQPPRTNLIYVFRIDDERHAGCVKVGMTSLGDDDDIDVFSLKPQAECLNAAARKRIQLYTGTAAVPYVLLYTEITSYITKKGIGYFEDHDVHKVLIRSGIKRKVFDEADHMGREWFETSVETVKHAIKAVKDGRQSLLQNEVFTTTDPIIFRPEQADAIRKTLQRFKKGNQMLWFAKMRFGKTLCALEVINEMRLQKTLILTHRPVVDEGWFNDFKKIFYDSPQYEYGSRIKGETFENLIQHHLREDKNIVYFASIQDLRGSETVGGKFDKNAEIFQTDWDLIIIDEAHEGTQTSLGKSVTDKLIKKGTKVLHLSGTPFNLLDGFNEEEVFVWDYVMEQRAKLTWDAKNFGDPNPYANLPKLHIFTYNLGTLLQGYRDDTIAFNFREFFRTDSQGNFTRERDIRAFLDLLTREDEKSEYPFSNEKYRQIFRHTLWLVPGINAAKALSKLLQNHHVFRNFQVVNVTGDGDEDEENEKALALVEKAIGKKPEETYTITISCGRLTTGVTVPAWTGVFMLAGSYTTSASSYMQTIFRVQSPAIINGKVKQDCYVFDFAPDRTLQVLATVPKASSVAGKKDSSTKKALEDFLNFCPVIAMIGSEMKPINVNQMMEQLKKAYVERVVRNGFEDSKLYNDELLHLDDIAIKDFHDLKGIIGQTKAIAGSGEIPVNTQGLTGEEKKERDNLEKKKKKEELSEEEKERLAELNEKKKIRESAISILRGISIRMPLLIYGANVKDEDKELTIDNFASLIDTQSWHEFMPKGVTKAIFSKFKRYYDPEIFAAASKRIRAMTRAADTLTIEDRISRIATIFLTFRNPDKETVLTSWRVVNLHMGDTLGGFNFYDEKYENQLDSPRFIDHGSITTEVYNENSRLLEINSKTGLYPLYLAYNLYRKRLEEEIVPPESLEGHLALWDEVVSKNLFIICKTPMAERITQRTLAGFRNVPLNTKHFDNLILMIAKTPHQFVSKITKQTWKKQGMQTPISFTAVVGNPPYQEVVAQKETKNGQKRSSNIFHYFQMAGEKLGRYTSFIYPGARWIHRAGKGLDQFGKDQINDPHLYQLEFFPNSQDIFTEVALADGLSIVLKDMSKTSPGFRYIYKKNGEALAINADNPGDSLFPLNPLDNNIVNQLTLAIQQYGCLSESILSQKLFSIESDFAEKNPSLVREYKKGDNFDPKTEIKLLTNDKAGKAGRATWFITKRDVITTGLDYLDRWKVIVSSANAGGQKRDNQIAVIDNLSAFGRARVALKTFATEKEAQNFFKYATSEIIRFAFLLTDESLTSLAKKVPDLQDYSDANGLIDYNGDVNSQLYDFFNLSGKDREYVRGILDHRSR